MVFKGHKAKIYIDGIEIGCCRDVSFRIGNELIPYYELQNPIINRLIEGTIEATGTIRKAWINTYYLRLLGISEDGFSWSNSRSFTLELRASESGPGIIIYNCKFTKSRIDISQNGWSEEEYDFILGTARGLGPEGFVLIPEEEGVVEGEDEIQSPFARVYHFISSVVPKYNARTSAQRGCFHAQGLFWTFFSDDSPVPEKPLYYATSSDGQTWTKEIICQPTYLVVMDGVDFYLDGNYLHYIRQHPGGGNMKYRRGLLNSDGSITWSAPEQDVGISAYQNAVIMFDSNGLPWIGFVNRGDYIPKVTKSSTNDGTWTTASGFPYSLGSAVPSGSTVIPCTLKNGKMYFLFGRTTIYGRLFDGSWQPTTTVATGLYDSSITRFSAVGKNDMVHFGYMTSGYEAKYKCYTYGSGWGSEELVASGLSSTLGASTVAVTVNSFNRPYLFYFKPGTNNDDIFYRKKKDTWEAEKLLVSDAAPQRQYCLQSSLTDYNNKIQIIWAGIDPDFYLNHIWIKTNV